MRMYRNLAALVTATAVCVGPWFHWMSVGAVIGMLLCAYLWRHELWLWLHETWRRFWAEVYRG